MRLTKYRGVWCVAWAEGGGTRRISLGTQDRAEADRRYRDWQSDQRRQRSLTTIGEIVLAYFEDKEANGSRSVGTQRHAWKAMAQTFDGLQPHHVTRGLCRQYTAQCQAAGLSNGTIRHRLAALSGALHWHDPNSPAVIEVPPPPPPRDRYLTRDEARRLIDNAGSPHIYLFIVLALTTAARAGALLDLTWGRVDIDRGRINLGEGAGNKRRARVPINGSARDALVAAREAAQTDWVIEYAGRQVGSVKKGFARACVRAGMDGVSPHVLRHTAAVWMAEAGVPMSEISQYLGHTSTAVTERVYARYSPDYLRGAADALEVGFGSSDQKITRFRRAK